MGMSGVGGRRGDLVGAQGVSPMIMPTQDAEEVRVPMYTYTLLGNRGSWRNMVANSMSYCSSIVVRGQDAVVFVVCAFRGAVPD